LNSKILNILFASDKMHEIHFQTSSMNGFQLSILSGISPTIHYSVKDNKKDHIIPE